MVKNFFCLILLLLVFLYCDSSKHLEKPISKKNVTTIPEEWINQRVENTMEKLQNNEAGEIILKSLEFHGGLKNWYQQRALEFQFNYMPLNGKARNSIQIVDTWGHKNVHTDLTVPNAKFGWNGEQYWQNEESKVLHYDPVFWSLTPIFFLGQPFVHIGEGVHLEYLGEIQFNNIDYEQVKVTYAPNTGEAPDDYYINYYNKETFRLEVIRYIVSYPKKFKNGGHSPEKIMLLDNFENVDGFIFPTKYKTYPYNKNINFPKEELLKTNTEVLKIKFHKNYSLDNFKKPKEADFIRN